jgi:hypothetical protein
MEPEIHVSGRQALTGPAPVELIDALAQPRFGVDCAMARRVGRFRGEDG